MIFAAIALLGLMFFAANKGKAVPVSGPKRQQISSQAREGFRTGSDKSVGFKNRGEGSQAIVGKQNVALTDSQAADITERMNGAYDPEWQMRWRNAYHRITLQQAINRGERPPAGTPVVIPRVANGVNQDTEGLAASWTRRFFNYHQRFTHSSDMPQNASPIMPIATLDQNDDADQTAIATVLKPGGHKSVIYPKIWSAPVRDLRKEWDNSVGASYNYAKTPQSQPPRRGITVDNSRCVNKQGSTVDLGSQY